MGEMGKRKREVKREERRGKGCVVWMEEMVDQNSRKRIVDIARSIGDILKNEGSKLEK